MTSPSNTITPTVSAEATIAFDDGRRRLRQVVCCVAATLAIVPPLFTGVWLLTHHTVDPSPSLYGRVVDGHGVGVLRARVGADAVGSNFSMMAMARRPTRDHRVVLTDAEGNFQFVSTNGESISVTDVTKRGYGFGKLVVDDRAGTTSPQPDGLSPERRQIFRIDPLP